MHARWTFPLGDAYEHMQQSYADLQKQVNRALRIHEKKPLPVEPVPSAKTLAGVKFIAGEMAKDPISVAGAAALKTATLQGLVAAPYVYTPWLKEYADRRGGLKLTDPLVLGAIGIGAMLLLTSRKA